LASGNLFIIIRPSEKGERGGEKLSEENVACPYCGGPVPKHGMHTHLTYYCPAVLGKAAMVLAPGRPEYEEGEVPEPAKSLIMRKGSFLTEAGFE